jgi:hypothetical protein
MNGNVIRKRLVVEGKKGSVMTKLEKKSGTQNVAD